MSTLFNLLAWSFWFPAVWTLLVRRNVRRTNRFLAVTWCFWLLADITDHGSALSIGMDVAGVMWTVYLGWHDDDDWKRRRKRLKESLKVAFRSFAPSPIAMPGAA
jgi:hypothetical protein